MDSEVSLHLVSKGLVNPDLVHERLYHVRVATSAAPPVRTVRVVKPVPAKRRDVTNKAWSKLVPFVLVPDVPDNVEVDRPMRNVGTFLGFGVRHSCSAHEAYATRAFESGEGLGIWCNIVIFCLHSLNSALATGIHSLLKLLL
jgi:hypothetical protein